MEPTVLKYMVLSRDQSTEEFESKLFYNKREALEYRQSKFKRNHDVMIISHLDYLKIVSTFNNIG